MNFIERENEILKILKLLKNTNMIVVGGYAVSARAKHRFSVDCDIVIPKSELKKIADILERDGFEKSISKDDFENIYAGEFLRYVKKIEGLPVSVDILVNSLISRTTEASWSFEFILKDSNKTNVTGIQESVECVVPSKELLLAFKIHSGRKTDLRDIIMLQDADWDIVKKYADRGNKDVLKNQIEIFIKDLDDNNLVDSLKGVFQLKEDVEKTIEGTKKKLSNLIKSLK